MTATVPRVHHVTAPDGAADYGERIYAGVLGKIIGVYLGRPVEGWSYPDLQKRFGELSYYVNAQLDEPLVVADDDVSGTFAFARALEDHDYPAVLEARQVGDTWLNYIIENRTILWWGGLGRSTEHTAFLRLKAGIPAPASGSVALNGPVLPEQVGAQIFSDAFAMAYPGDPGRAAAAVRAAASVSHDGVALEAASFLAAMRALAFDVTQIDELIDQCRRYLQDERLTTAVDEVLAACGAESDWREVRDRIDRDLGYSRFAGPCHVIPNHAMTLAALLLGGDNFQRSVMIAASAGFDTDSNAGVVGCLNGIRLGLDAVNAQVDLRAPVADRLLVVTADGGSCVSDAVQETRRLVRAASVLRGEQPPSRQPRFGFEYRGSRQGFVPCPYVRTLYPSVMVGNANEDGQAGALRLRCNGVGPGIPGGASTPVFVDTKAPVVGKLGT
ncbi:MAG: ADP-ribosylglycohydrolase family protein, partial [Frankia sp.]